MKSIQNNSHNIILFELDFNVKFSLLRLLQLLSDLKSTIVVLKVIAQFRGTNNVFAWCNFPFFVIYLDKYGRKNL